MINKWLEKTIIGLDLCPFTRKPYAEGKIQIEELPGQSSSVSQENFLTSLSAFQDQKKFETILMVFSHWDVPFREFYEFSEDCENHLMNLELADEFQIVAFHPRFCFEGLTFSDRANLVNSSPFPVIHILKISDLDAIGMSEDEAENMSFSNAKKLESLSPEDIAEHFPWR